ncbi:MAG: NAD(P)/FAD-dependent oxidoreductase [Egibacteraceae bacterium]
MGSGDVVVIGAGPAGLTAAYQLAKAEVPAVVLEADDVVGGLSRTVERDGWRFDIGGHRFFTKSREVEALWHELLPDGELMQRTRRSRILYRGRFYDYPLRPLNALRNLGVVEAARCVLSYVHARLRPPADLSSFEGWVIARFGRRLYEHFFKTYTEKVWGVPGTEITADWAAQRIKSLSLGRALASALRPWRSRRELTTLIERFHYPRLGPGMMWERCRDRVEAAGNKVVLRQMVTRVRHADGRAVSVEASNDGTVTEYPCSAVISSMPLPELLAAMDPPAPPHVRDAAAALRFRDFLSVALVVPAEDGFEDNWIYVHAPEVALGRIQNFGSWSPYLVKDGRTCLGLEYFVFEGDALWERDDEDLVATGTHELAVLGLVDPGRVEEGYVVRMPKAYPVYDEHYHANVDVVRGWLATHATNVHPVGRNGMHRYNNQDHSMLTAMRAVDNVVGRGEHDVWAINLDDDYHEAGGEPGTGRSAPVVPRATLTAGQTSIPHDG